MEKMANWKIRSSIFVLLLLFRASLGGCMAAPTTDNAEDESLSSVKTSIRLLNRMVGEILRQSQFPLGENLTCFLFARYNELSSLLPKLPQDNGYYTDISALTFVAERALNDSCQWLKLKSPKGNTDCTPEGIASMCIRRSFGVIEQHRGAVDAYDLENPAVSGTVSFSTWLGDNIDLAARSPPEEELSVILTVSNCCSTETGTFYCSSFGCS